jgi:very-short-patch-repair endonuclease
MRAPPKTMVNARHLRGNLSAPEVMPWSRLRTRPGNAGLPPSASDRALRARFLLREGPARNRPPDCDPGDGMSHDVEDRPRRDAWLSTQGVTTRRIAAKEVTARLDDVADGLTRLALAMIESKAPSTALTRGPPPPLRGGG